MTEIDREALNTYKRLADAIAPKAKALLLRYMKLNPDERFTDWGRYDSTNMDFHSYDPTTDKLYFEGSDHDGDRYDFALPASYLWDNSWEATAAQAVEERRLAKERSEQENMARERAEIRKRERAMLRTLAAKHPDVLVHLDEVDE